MKGDLFMELKEMKMNATKNLKEIEKQKKTLLMLLSKIDDLKEIPKDKKEKAIEKLNAWVTTSGVESLL